MMARNTIPIVGLSGVLWLFGTVPGFAGEQTHQAGTPDKPLARLMQQYREKQDITIDDKELVKMGGYKPKDNIVEVIKGALENLKKG